MSDARERRYGILRQILTRFESPASGGVCYYVPGQAMHGVGYALRQLHSSPALTAVRLTAIMG